MGYKVAENQKHRTAKVCSTVRQSGLIIWQPVFRCWDGNLATKYVHKKAFFPYSCFCFLSYLHDYMKKSSVNFFGREGCPTDHPLRKKSVSCLECVCRAHCWVLNLSGVCSWGYLDADSDYNSVLLMMPLTVTCSWVAFLWALKLKRAKSQKCKRILGLREYLLYTICSRK